MLLVMLAVCCCFAEDLRRVLFGACVNALASRPRMVEMVMMLNRTPAAGASV